MSQYLYAHRQWPASRVATDQRDSVRVRKIEKSCGKPLQPMNVYARQSQRERRPRRRRAHGGQVAQIDGKRTMTYRARIATDREMTTRHDRIHGHDQIRAFR